MFMLSFAIGQMWWLVGRTRKLLGVGGSDISWWMQSSALVGCLEHALLNVLLPST